MQFDPRLWQFTAGVRGRMAASALIGVAAAVAGVARLALLGWLLAGVLRGEKLSALVPPILIVAAVMLLRGGLEYWRAMAAHRTAADVQLHVRRQIHDHVIALGPAHFGLTRTGDVMLALVDGVEQLETYFGQYLPQLFVAAVTPIGIFVFAATLDLPVAAILLGFALFSLIAPSAFHKWDADNSLRRQRAYGSFAAEFLDSVQGLATLKAFGQSRARVERLTEKAHEVFQATMWVLSTNALSRGITDTGIALGAAAALGYGAYRVQDGAMSLEALLIILMMGVEVFRPMRDLRGMLHQGMLGAGAAEGIFAVLNARPIVEAKPAPADMSADLPATIEFDDVTFSYPGARKSAHEHLSFRIDAGERVGVIGASGAGKTSIIRLLVRLYDPESGIVRVGGRDVRELDLDVLRGQIALVSQDTYLFHGTVEDNLRFGKPAASQAELEAAAEAANAHGFICRLPNGYATVIGERGIRLSGGQRQRIAIARALLRDAPILVLDEALSAVDAENEAVIQQALDRLMRGRTTLISAHRLSSVIDCDRILVLDRRRIIETGDHADLMSLGGEYARLMGAQATEEDGVAVLLDEPPRDLAADRPADLPRSTMAAPDRPTDAILRAEGMGWTRLMVEMMRLIMPWKGRLTATFVLGVIRVLAFIGVGVLSALVVASLKGGGEIDGLVIALLVVAPLAGFVHWIESWIAHDMAYRLLSEMRIALFDKLERLAPAYMLRRRTGDLVAMATQDVETVEYFFAHTVAPAFVAVLVPATVLVTLFMYGPAMAVALIPFLVAVGVGPWILRRRVDDIASRAREALAGLNAHAVDTIQGLAEIVAFQQAARRGGEFVTLIQAYNAVRLPFFRDLTMQTVVLEAATGLGGLAVVATGASLVSAGQLDSAAMPLLTLLAMAAFLPVSEIADIGRQLADTLGATRRLYAVHDEPVPVTDGPGVATGPRDAGIDLHIDHVAFAYDEAERSALEDVSLDVPAGSTVALVGPSGAGKSTIAHLLMRFFDPLHGAIRMGDSDYTRFKLDDLRRRIALVTQDTYLFNETLRANILLARPNAGDAEVDAAVRRAALSDFIDSLPDGLDTAVGERGVRLSGGQRQRVAIARAFLKDAPVLILDEATSHLDAANEQAVRRSLAALMRDRTTLVIAHRLSTVRDADLIAVMDEGRVVETGLHEQLLARGGMYARLVSRQVSVSRAPTAAE